MGVVRYLGTNTVWAELQRVSSGLQRLSSGFLIFTKIPFQEKRSGMQNHNGCRIDSKADFRATDGSDRCCSHRPDGRDGRAQQWHRLLRPWDLTLIVYYVRGD